MRAYKGEAFSYRMSPVQIRFLELRKFVESDKEALKIINDAIVEEGGPPIGRNSVAEWKRKNPSFYQAIEHLSTDVKGFYRAKAQARTSQVFDILDRALDGEPVTRESMEAAKFTARLAGADLGDTPQKEGAHQTNITIINPPGADDFIPLPGQIDVKPKQLE